MPRPQFTLRTLLVAVLVVGAFFGGMRFGERREKQRRRLQEEREIEEFGFTGAAVSVTYPGDKTQNGVRTISRGRYQFAPWDD